jgi:hypothetical protein
LSGAVPDVYSLEEWIITVVESTSIGVELVGEYQLLLGAIVGSTLHNRRWCIWVDQALSQVCQKRLVLFALDTERIVRARSDLFLCQFVDESTVALSADMNKR